MTGDHPTDAEVEWANDWWDSHSPARRVGIARWVSQSAGRATEPTPHDVPLFPEGTPS